MFRFLKRADDPDDALAAPVDLAPALVAEPQPTGRPRSENRPSAPESIDKASRKLNLVHRDLLLKAIDQAVRRGIAAHVPNVDAKTLEKAVFGTRNELVRILKESSRSVRGLPKAAFLREVEEDRQRILAERERVQTELEGMLVELDRRREETKQVEAQLLWESRQSGIAQDEALTQRIFELFGGTSASHENAAVREQVTFLILQALNQERDKVVEAQMTEHRREVENFERRLAKLTHSLEVTEEELTRMAKAKGIDPGVASIYRSVQGLDSAEGSYEAKLEMMASIFEANFALQKGVAVEK